MGDSSLPILLAIIGMALLVGEVFSLTENTNSLSDELNAYDGSYTTGEQIDNSPSLNESGFSLGSIPIVGGTLGFVSWLLESIGGYIYNVAILPSFFPDWMNGSFVLIFLAFIIYAYVALVPSK